MIRCEPAGVKREDVEITLSDGVLHISGERRSELNEEEVSFYTRERFYGTFRRSMSLPEGIHEDDIDATFEDRVLELTVQRGAPAVSEPRPYSDQGYLQLDAERSPFERTLVSE